MMMGMAKCVSTLNGVRDKDVLGVKRLGLCKNATEFRMRLLAKTVSTEDAT
jgi:hypothetical protein